MFSHNAPTGSGPWMWLFAAMMFVLLIGFVFVSAVSGVLASMMGGGSTNCPVGALPTATSMRSSLYTSPAGNILKNALTWLTPPHRDVIPELKATQSPLCIPPGKYGAAVVVWAKAMADALYVNPACSGHISYPNCYYTWYNSSFPPAVIAYGEKVCPGCSAWANGTYQCVSFVRGAYSQVYPMTVGANAFDLWAVYRTMPGWLEIPSGEAPPGKRGMPAPGDVLIFKDPGVGHAAIVMTVELPHNGQNGAITFANANSVSPYTTMPLRPDLSVDTSSWPGYIAWGYLRPAVHM